MQVRRHCADQENIRPRIPAEDGLASETKDLFCLSPGAGETATDKSNASGLKFPPTVRGIITVFKLLIRSDDVSHIPRRGCDSLAADGRSEEMNRYRS